MSWGDAFRDSWICIKTVDGLPPHLRILLKQLEYSPLTQLSSFPLPLPRKTRRIQEEGRRNCLCLPWTHPSRGLCLATVPPSHIPITSQLSACCVPSTVLASGDNKMSETAPTPRTDCLGGNKERLEQTVLISFRVKIRYHSGH